MARAIVTARRAAAFDVPILLTGESGSGKHTLAAAIHRWSPRRAGPFVTIQCEAWGAGENLGRRTRYPADAWQRTAPRIRAAHRGTVFFEEIGALPALVQARLLGLLDQLPRGRATSEPIEADARVIAATDHDLEQGCRAGRFREDLFFRLNVFRIHVPALRERPEDLRGLTARILETLCVRYRRALVELAPEVHQALARYQWPGNVRELVSVLERAVALSTGSMILEAHLPDRVLASLA